jgi:chromosome segregation ATPase
MKRARRKDTSPPTPDSNRARIHTLEEYIARLEKLVDEHERSLAQHERELGTQLQRIGQLQADLDAIRAAWVKANALRRRT